MFSLYVEVFRIRKDFDGFHKLDLQSACMDFLFMCRVFTSGCTVCLEVIEHSTYFKLSTYIFSNMGVLPTYSGK